MLANAAKFWPHFDAQGGTRMQLLGNAQRGEANDQAESQAADTRQRDPNNRDAAAFFLAAGANLSGGIKACGVGRSSQVAPLQGDGRVVDHPAATADLGTVASISSPPRRLASWRFNL